MINFETPGRMLGISKSSYRLRHPDHLIVFNANVCTRSNGKIWHGDLNLDLDLADLQVLAAALNEDVYVLREYDARFENEPHPLFTRAVARITPSGELIYSRSQDDPAV